MNIFTNARLAWVALLMMLPGAALLSAAYGSEDPHKEHLYESFISPCCWRENLAVHDSGTAGELRGRIDAMVASGQSDEQIKTVLIDEYGKRILALPEGAERVWLFWTPFAAVGIGLAGLFLLLRRMRRKPPTPRFPIDIKPAALPPGFEDEF